MIWGQEWKKEHSKAGTVICVKDALAWAGVGTEGGCFDLKDFKVDIYNKDLYGTDKVKGIR